MSSDLTDPDAVFDVASCYRSLRLLLASDYEAGLHFAPVQDDTAGPIRPVAEPNEAQPRPPPAAPPPAALAEPEPVFRSDGDAQSRLQYLAQVVSTCQRCGLCQGRQQTVAGEGNPQAELLFVGEGPGYEEDCSGRPFVGPAGQLLDKMIQAMGLSRDRVYIANIVKCRPPNNRAPDPEEAAACLPFLREQVAIIQPRIICSLGNTPLRALSGNPQAGITRARGQTFTWQGYTVLPTFHPSYLLRNPGSKRPAWEDLKKVLQLLGI